MINRIETRIRTYAIQEEAVKGLHDDADDLIVTNSRFSSGWVTLDWHGRNISVSAEDLRRAIQNATNHD